MSAKPNILILMVDQLNGTLFPDGPADWLHAPNLKKLAESVDALYHHLHGVASLCAGACGSASCQVNCRRAMAFMTMPPSFAATFRPTRITCDARAITPASRGKMHFVGPDQLHGFEDRLTTDIYPADFRLDPGLSQTR